MVLLNLSTQSNPSGLEGFQACSQLVSFNLWTWSKLLFNCNLRKEKKLPSEVLWEMWWPKMVSEDFTGVWIQLSLVNCFMQLLDWVCIKLWPRSLERKTKQRDNVSNNLFRTSIFLSESLLWSLFRIYWSFGGKSSWPGPCKNAGRLSTTSKRKKKLHKCFQCVCQNNKRRRSVRLMERIHPNNLQSCCDQFGYACFIRWD